jgi:hypothetical protein
VFGDIVVTYERMQEVEFSFFTLPDSGAFLTHAPKRLSEALALVYPFQMEVWPALIFTVLITGPILYLMISIPEWIYDRQQMRKSRMHYMNSFYSMIYINEITRRNKIQRPVNNSKRMKRFEGLRHEDGFETSRRRRQLKRDGLFSRCVWFTCHIFLRQCSLKLFFFFSIFRFFLHSTTLRSRSSN